MAITYSPIATTTLGSDAADVTSVTFQVSHATYTDLVVVNMPEILTNASSGVKF
jgi:hypothetical protein